MKARLLIWVPLAAFVAVLALAVFGLRQPAEHDVRSTMIGRPLPAIALPSLIAGKPGVDSRLLPSGKPYLVNVFASWCLPCKAEAPQLMQLKQSGIEIVGIATADTPEAMHAFLAENGDPFSAIGDDRRRLTQIALGSSGVPETFIVDGHGKIVEQHIGYVGPQDMSGIVAALGKAK